MLNIVISILKLKELAVILGRWNLAEARKHMPEGRVDTGSCTSYRKEWRCEAALPPLSEQVSSWSTRPLMENLPCPMLERRASGICKPGFW